MHNEEPNEVSRRADGQGPELVPFGRPFRERSLPREIEQGRRVLAESQTREGTRERGVGQSRFRRYVVTLAS
jgi:hypothetical protein